MKHPQKHTVKWLICAAIFITGLIKTTECCRFGDGCTYDCHCMNGDLCTETDGSCPDPGCDDGGWDGTAEDLLYTGAWSGYGCQYGNVAYDKTSYSGPQASGGNVPSRANDGNHNRDIAAGSCAVAVDPFSEGRVAYWMVNLGALYVIDGVVITTAMGAEDTLTNSKVEVTTDRADESSFQICKALGEESGEMFTLSCDESRIGQYVRIQKNVATTTLSICEVQVMGYLHQDCSDFSTGVACTGSCNCDAPCHDITGFCPGSCDQGWSGSSCQIADVQDAGDSDDGGYSVIIGVVILIVLLVVIAIGAGVGFIFYRRRKRDAAANSSEFFSGLEDGGSAESLGDTNLGGSEYKIVRVKELQNYVRKLSHTDDGFKKEYKTVKNMSQGSISGTGIEIGNGVAPDSDVDSCYLKGYPDRERAFIICAAPTAGNGESFWNLVWESNAVCVVCLLTPEEMKEESCWPASKTDSGKYSVMLENMNGFINYKVANIKLGSRGEDKSVAFLHYMGWSAGRDPLSAGSLLEARKLVLGRCKNNNGPVVLYCNSSFGRSATYACIDYSCEQAIQVDKVDIFNYSIYMRRHCSGLEQSLKQYRFQYLAVLDHISSQPHSLKPSSAKRDEEFRLLRELIADYSNQEDEDMSNPLAIVDKNSPVDAVYVDGPSQGRAYATFSVPPESNVEHFWSVLLKLNTETLVIMGDVHSKVDFLPITKGVPFTNESVTAVIEGEENGGNVTISMLKVTQDNTSSKSPSMLKMFVYEGWSSNEDTPPSQEHLRQLLDAVHAWHLKGKHNSAAPIAVVCRTGVRQCGLFTTCSILERKSKLRASVDVFNTVKQVRLSKPDFIHDNTQYKFLYDFAGKLQS